MDLDLLIQYLVTLIRVEGHQVSPASCVLKVVAPFLPVVVKKLSRVGWFAEAKDDDKKLSQMWSVAACPGSLLQRNFPLTIILIEYLVRWCFIKFPPGGD